MFPEKERVTLMILYVDLKCPFCYKKVKKLLSKFPQIRGQVFDEEKNKVMITVICHDPERIRDKLCYNGGKSIQSIEVLEPPPPKKPEKQQPKKPEPVPQLLVVPQPQPEPVKMPEPKQPEPIYMPVSVPMGPFYPPVSMCCQCQDCYVGGPCYNGYGRQVPTYYDGYGYRPPGYVRDDYYRQEDPQGCSIM